MNLVKLFFTLVAVFFSFVLFVFNADGASLLYVSDTVSPYVTVDWGQSGTGKVAAECQGPFVFSATSTLTEFRYPEGMKRLVGVAASFSFGLGTTCGGADIVSVSVASSSISDGGFSSFSVSLPNVSVNASTSYYYSFVIGSTPGTDCTSLGSNCYRLRYSSTDSELNQRRCSVLSPATLDCDGSNRDLGGEFYGYVGSSANFQVDLLFPYYGLVTDDFLYWTARIASAPSSTSDRFLVVDYSSSSTLVGVDKVNSVQISNTNQNYQVSFKKTVLLATTTLSVWYARASIVDGRQVVATSSIVSFTVNPVGNLIPGIAGTAPILFDRPPQRVVDDCSQFSLGIFSSSTGQAVLCYIRQGVYWLGDVLFVPATSSQIFLADSVSDFQGTFPFSVFYSVQQGVASSSLVVVPSLSLSLPVLVGGSNVSISILSSSTLSNLVGVSQKDNYFTVLSNLMWLALGFVLILHLRHL